MLFHLRTQKRRQGRFRYDHQKTDEIQLLTDPTRTIVSGFHQQRQSFLPQGLGTPEGSRISKGQAIIISST